MASTPRLVLGGGFSLGVLLALLMASVGSVRAQDIPPDERNFDVQLFHQPVGPHGYITLDTAKVPQHLQFGLSLMSNYQRGAFHITVESDRPELQNSFDVVRNQITSELAGAIGLLDMFEVGVAVPITLYLQGQDYTSLGQPDQPLSGGGVGDIRVEGKAKLASFGANKEFTFALSPGITLPTGDGQKFLGEKSVTGRLRALTEFQQEKFRALLMVGFLGRGKTRTFQSELGSQFLYGVGVEYKPHEQLGILGEFFGRVGSAKYVDANPNEVDLAMRIGLPHMFSIAFGGGAGLSKAIGSPSYRAFLTLAWAPDFRDADGDGIPDAEDKCPDQPEDHDGFKDKDGCPDPDNDADNVPDALDKCPNDAEDLDQFQDEDGCPETDNDGDGIPDLNDPCPNAAEDGKGKRPKDGCPSSAEDSDGDGVADARDKCPDEPEDRDGFEDNDGCPDVDNDGDGIPDNFDACPNDPEDADGFEDTDGCPEPDNDKDGVPDAKDRCPMQPETLNGNRDDDGCPDSGTEIVRLVGDKIEVRDRINFTSSGGKVTVAPASATVMKLVSMVLKGHSEITMARIEVTAEREAEGRAAAVQAALVANGVEATRLKTESKAGTSKVEIVVETRAEPRKPAPAAAPAAP
jgi:OOP family OmpA-OmpF porin